MTDDGPPALRDCSQAAGRVYDALADADDPLSRAALQRQTRHAESTVLESLAELRDAGLVERVGRWPVPKYGLADDDLTNP